MGHHALAKIDNKVIGYALFMSKSLEMTIPVLQPMFEQFKKIPINGKSLYESNYFVMGQVCIDKNYRGQKIFDGLYHFLKEKNHQKYDWIVTEVATRNTRSIRAHQRVGFEAVNVYKSTNGEEWTILGWEIQK